MKWTVAPPWPAFYRDLNLCKKGLVRAEYYLFINGYGFINAVTATVFQRLENFIITIYNIYNVLNFQEIVAMRMKWNAYNTKH